MDERLKQIWSGFEAVTTRNLTGKGVENILVPHRSDYVEDDSQFLPEGFESPAESAFDTLRADLAAKRKKFARKRKSDEERRFDAPETATPFNGDDLFQGMHATSMRVERTDLDYVSFLASDAGKAVLKKNKKKRFGIF